MADNPYTAPAISGYNSSPPPDGGETTDANTLKWATHKDKLADPIKTLSESDITNTTTAFSKVINTDADQNNSMAGSLAFAESILTIASGSVTAKRTAHAIAAQTGTADDLANIATGSVSDFALLIITPDTGDTITVKHAATGAGEIHLADDTDYVMSNDESLMLQRRGTDWYELTRDDMGDTKGVIQIVNTETGAVATGTTVMVDDDTIPQNTEGNEFMTLAITPKSATSTLKIIVTWQGANTAASSMVVALFVDTTANALAAIQDNSWNVGVDNPASLTFTHSLAASSTSARTYKVRAGLTAAGTTTFNGTSGGRKMGGVMASSITILEHT